MAQLADAYLASRVPGASPDAAETIPAAALEDALATLCARGRAAHPALVVEDAVFAVHLGRCGAPVAAVAASASARAAPEAQDVHAADLFLCCAGLLGDETAVKALRAQARPVLFGYLRGIDASPAFVDEVEQRLWDAVLVGSPDAPPKLAGYSGKGPLAGWLGIVAQRIALTMHRNDASERRAAEGAGIEASLVAGDPELALVKGHLRGPFQRVITRALDALDDRQRMVYRMHIIDGLSLERIGKTYGVSQSTVSRWMGSARASIVAEAQRLLHDELKASPEDYESMSRLLVSQLDLSVSRLLGKSA